MILVAAPQERIRQARVPPQDCPQAQQMFTALCVTSVEMYVIATIPQVLHL